MNERKPIDRIDSGISDGEEERFEGHSPLRTADSDRVFKFGADNDDVWIFSIVHLVIYLGISYHLC